jgi:hypothetical protein
LWEKKAFLCWAFHSVSTYLESWGQRRTESAASPPGREAARTIAWEANIAPQYFNLVQQKHMKTLTCGIVCARYWCPERGWSINQN